MGAWFMTTPVQSAAPPLPAGIREAWAEIDGHRMRYLTGGSGRPLLLIHGLMGYSFSWRFNLSELAQHATVYAVDLLGMGFSERCRVDCSLRAIAGYMSRFLDHFNIREYDLLGTSHGGAVAIVLASLDPTRVRRLLLSAPANPWSPYGRWLAPFLSRYPGRLAVPLLARSQWFLEYQLHRMYAEPSRITPGTMEGYAAAIAVPGTTEHVRRILGSWLEDLEEVRRVLPTLADVPTLVLWGSRDLPVRFASAAPLLANFRHAELKVLDDVGHLPYEAVPDDFNRAVIEFLTR
jgi:pimeloyl-ACP methyl ester carboxylesterase